MKRLSNTEAEFKKSVAYKKKGIFRPWIDESFFCQSFAMALSNQQLITWMKRIQLNLEEKLIFWFIQIQTQIEATEK